MTCAEAKQQIAAAWSGELGEADRVKLRAHVEVCPECAGEMAELGAIWERLADLPAPEPGLGLHLRWRATLAAMSGERRRFSLESLWPRRIGWQIAIAAACLLLGIAAGTAIPNRRTDAGEIAALRHEVENTRELVALSLLNQQSAASRLRGIDYSLRLPALEPNVVSALVAAVNRDPNVNVRLAAIDALSRAADNARVRQALAASLDAQNSPMVQAALIDYLADSRDPAALPVLRQFSAKPDLNPLVKQHAVQAVWRMDR